MSHQEEWDKHQACTIRYIFILAIRIFTAIGVAHGKRILFYLNFDRSCVYVLAAALSRQNIH